MVTRYFGGTKLGKGGLARAYREAARAALSGAPIARVTARVVVRLDLPIEWDGETRHLVAKHGGTVEEASYPQGARAVLRVALPAEGLAALSDEFEDLTRGTGVVEPVG